MPRTENTDKMDWCDATIARLRQLWDEGHPTAEIGRRLGTSKNAVVGKAHRLDLPNRKSPIKRGGPARPRPTPTRPKVPKLAEIMPLTVAVPATNAPQALPQPDPPEPKPAAAEPRALRPQASKPCCWPIGDPGTTGFRFCDQPALAGKPYCEEHSRKAYAPARSGDQPTHRRLGLPTL